VPNSKVIANSEVLFNDASVDGVLKNKDVIPARPYLKPKGIDLAIQMNATLDSASRPINPKDLVDSSLIPVSETGSVQLLEVRSR
jgi:hypothetical protein